MSARKRWLWAAVAFGLLLVAVGLVFNSRFYKMHEARCVFVAERGDKEIITNSCGEVVQPDIWPKKPDVSVQYASARPEGVEYAKTFRDSHIYRDMVSDFVTQHIAEGYSEAKLRAIFDSFEFAETGSPIFVATFSVFAKDRKLAVAAMEVVYAAFIGYVDEVYEKKRQRVLDTVDMELAKANPRMAEIDPKLYETLVGIWTSYRETNLESIRRDSVKFLVLKPPHVVGWRERFNDWRKEWIGPMR